MENNQVTVTGMISKECAYDHTMHGEDFYKIEITVSRMSGVDDVLPVLISERLFDVNEELFGHHVKVTGEYRSYNKREGERTRLILNVFAKEVEILDKEDIFEINYIFLDGYICKSPTYRKTPLDRDIADLLVAVNRPYGKTDYIPCVAWGRNARWAGGLSVGERVQIYGRIQSREYKKALSETNIETRVAYEVSINSISSVAE